MAATEVILREKIQGLGVEAEVVKVKAGYARNFLIPHGKAYEATKGNLRQIENLEKARVKREAGELTIAQDLAGKIARLKPKFTLEIGANGKAFGSVTSIDIHKALEDKGIEIDRTAIQLEKPIKTSGKTDVEVKLHADVTTSVTITVVSPEEAAE
ncbi:50S ribosomal protein L9 [bacterium]|nr:50S ribosomal protein L9 [Akkermansiaceae bacterium]MDB4287448.1 50S ribosomal protein L9 [bacterium]MDA7535785.1 50S ribosomal protein L9 [Akkermansiaceae bacterium]MDA7862902.1 50S ribosomal protein L9 [Akkermansiaceae bacterium]MDA8975434.1 50S ribosomal protein L9 [Akkermansiaceae bacterium]